MTVAFNVAPYIDPNVQHVGISKLRGLSASRLSNMRSTLVIQDNNTALAVLLRYEQYLAIQDQIRSLNETIQILTDEKAKAAAGLKAFEHGQTRPSSVVKAAGNKAKLKAGDKND